jgi:hypothetical protein
MTKRGKEKKKFKFNWKPNLRFDQKKLRKLFKLGKIKLIILGVIIAVSLIFQVWEYNANCLKIVCEPIIGWILYYVFWLFDLLAIPILSNVPPNRIILMIIKAIFLVLQVIYWYLLSCLIAIPVNKIRGRVNQKIKHKKKENDRIMKLRIKRDLEKAEELDKERIRKTANVF